MGQVSSERTRGDAFGEDGFVRLQRFFSPPAARAGDLVAHHAMTIHRADANRAPDRPRRALGLIYYGVSAREHHEEHEAYQRRLAAEMKQAGRI